MHKRELILFDLDGTLIDTAPDMAAALNDLLAAEGHDPLPFADIRPHVSHGAAGLLRVGFGDHGDTADSGRLRTSFLDRYQANLAGASRPFPGIAELLQRIEDEGRAWGVVTNKPGWLTEPLLRLLGLDTRAAVIVSGDTLAQRKPDPAPLLYACSQTGHAPAQTVYVGDAERDVAAGIAAGMDTFVALYGYLGPEDHPHEWGASALLEHPDDLWPHLSRPASTVEVP
ncbi:phosphoglycolate phosphatase [Halofilum ochraceum]|uniref:phosphoglycolate phosphatase n=1 Tax=Halofilum ochraceum TaxID=1611323 RepID=UPI0008D9F07B|nr:phosphoglycolate phosphatase [Halofilum ochraceum]